MNDKNPWLGLSSYKIEDSFRFFGRDYELKKISDIIRHNIFTTMYGLSGAGKTSIINAGLSPLLKKELYLPIYVRLEHGDNSLQFSQQIINAVENTLSINDCESEKITSFDTNEEDNLLWLYFHSHCFWSADNHKITPIIFIDQFEEIFTKNDDINNIWSFFNEINSLQYNVPTERLLDNLLKDTRQITFSEEMNFRIVFSMREDFLPRLEDYCYDIPVLRRNRIGIKPLNGLQALEVIMKPSPSLIDKDVALNIISKVAGKEILDNNKFLETIQVETSILSLFCSELYEYLIRDINSDKISNSLVDTHGGNILESFYNRNIQILPKKTIVLLENKLLTHSGFRNSVALEDFIENGLSNDQLLKLADSRIIKIEEMNHVLRVEFTHDVLCKIAKKHREKRKEGFLKKKINFENWLFGIETTIISLLFVCCLIVCYIHYPANVFNETIKYILFYICSFGFIFSKFLHFNNKHNKYLYSFLSFCIILTNPNLIYEVRMLPSLLSGYWRSFQLISVLLIIYSFLAAYTNKIVKYSSSLLYLIISLLLVRYMLDNNVYIWILWILMFHIVFLPYRYSRNKSVWYIMLICPLLYLLGYLTLPESHLPPPGFLFLLCYPLLYIPFTSKHKQHTVKQALNYCLTLSIYKERKFLRCCFLFFIGVILLSSTILSFLLLNDIVTATNIIVFGFISYICLDKTLYDQKIDEFRLFDGKKHKKYLAIFLILTLIVLLQYVPYGFWGQFFLLILTLPVLKKTYKGEAEGNRFLYWMQWIIPFIILPFVSFGYNPISLTQYGRTYNGKIENKFDMPFLIVKDFKGNVGMRDRSNLIIPVCYDKIRIRSIYVETWRSHLSPIIKRIGKGVFYNYVNDHSDYCHFSFYLHKQSKRSIWNCEKHLDSDNICTRYILNMYKNNCLEGDDSRYIDYLLQYNKPSDEIDKAIFDYYSAWCQKDIIVFYTYSDYRYLKYLNDKQLTSKLFDIINNQTAKLSGKFDQDKFIIENAKMKLMMSDIVGAKNELKKLSKRIDTQINLEAQKILLFTYILSKSYNEATSILNQYKGKTLYVNNALSDNVKKIFEKNYVDYSKVITFEYSVRNDLYKYLKLGIIKNKESHSFNLFKNNIDKICDLPLFDYEYKFIDEKCRLFIKLEKERTYGSNYDYMYFLSNDSIISPKFVRFSRFNDDDRIVVLIEKQKSKRIFYDIKEGKLIPNEFDFAWSFAEGKAIAIKDGKFVIVYKDGHYIRIPKSKTINDYEPKPLWIPVDLSNNLNLTFSMGLCPMIGENHKVGLIDSNGNWKVSPKFYHISNSFGDGLRIVTINGEEQEYGILNKYGKYIVKPTSQYIDYSQYDGILKIGDITYNLEQFYSKYYN